MNYHPGPVLQTRIRRFYTCAKRKKLSFFKNNFEYGHMVNVKS